MLAQGAMSGLLCSAVAGRAAEGESPLYQSRTVITGQDPERRGPGLIECFKLVLVKVSGDRRLMNDPATSLSADRIEPFIETIALHDQKAGRPVHDEQGTRDRPYDLTVTFKAAPIDAFLAKLNRKPWIAHRPALLALVAVRRGDLSFLLSRDGGRGPGMDEALANAADRFGLKVLLPTEAVLREAALTPRTVDRAGGAALRRLAGNAGAEVTLVGLLRWSDAALGWIVEWRLADTGKAARWSARGINFDEAFRIGVGGAARILSRNDPP
ncbi:DUF2066 domain-containing protein [Bradyrhizobium prioriisuperbiae]|uniref:DUF2066 domain-containing protein n=1 Tax=Bradyrhizobium prioriisuperbiae TaxID=2854389 RepID=UPI0028F00FEB|nr:DUF2066 domain-containing protein [Bradyrhizobium prioritasuperba]